MLKAFFSIVVSICTVLAFVVFFHWWNEVIILCFTSKCNNIWHSFFFVTTVTHRKHWFKKSRIEVNLLVRKYICRKTKKIEYRFKSMQDWSQLTRWWNQCGILFFYHNLMLLDIGNIVILFLLCRCLCHPLCNQTKSIRQTNNPSFMIIPKVISRTL